jgi:hypothetical protein
MKPTGIIVACEDPLTYDHRPGTRYSPLSSTPCPVGANDDETG